VTFETGDAHLGEASPITDRRTGLIVGADIAIAANITGDVIGQQLVIYLTALHELGHALGLPHSDDVGDIMYLFRRPDDPDRYFGAYRQRLRSVDDIGSTRAAGLSTRDIAALTELYN
jgi:predicted Zn-dependent protease